MKKYMMIFAVAAFAVILSVGMLVSSASAVTLDVVGGELMGASDVIVNGKPYNVEFVDGTADGIFDGGDEPSDFMFESSLEAESASLGLFFQVINPYFYPFFPQLVNGIESSSLGVTMTPWGPTIPGVEIGVMVLEFMAMVPPVVYPKTMNVLDDTGDDGVAVYAVWSVTPVPEPSTILLLGSGLVGIGVLRRKLKQR